MKIAIYGVDDLGQALGFRFSENGHTVTFTEDDIQDSQFQKHMEKASTFGAISAPVREAVHNCQYLLLTSPFSKARNICKSIQNLEERIVVDCTGPIGEKPDPSTKVNAIQDLKACSRGGRFVKTFNTVGPSVISYSDFGPGPQPACFLCGDDEEALEKVSILCDDLGMEPIVVGGLEWTPQLDALALLWNQLSQSGGLGEDFAWAVLRR